MTAVWEYHNSNQDIDLKNQICSQEAFKILEIVLDPTTVLAHKMQISVSRRRLQKSNVTLEEFCLNHYAMATVLEFNDRMRGRNQENTLTMDTLTKIIGMAVVAHYIDTTDPEMHTIQGLGNHLEASFLPFPDLCQPYRELASISMQHIHATLKAQSFGDCQFFQSIANEAKFQSFVDVFQIAVIPHSPAPPRGKQIITIPWTGIKPLSLIKSLLEDVGLDPNNAVQSLKFLPWMYEYYNPDQSFDIPHLSNNLRLKDQTMMEVNSVIIFFMQQPAFKLDGKVIPVDSIGGLKTIAAKISRHGHPMHIPALEHFNWGNLEAFITLKDQSSASSKGERVFQIINHFAKEMGMSEKFLAENVEVIMEFNHWKLECKDPAKMTPFAHALLVYSALLQAEKKKEEEAAAERERKRKEVIAAQNQQRRVELLAKLARCVQEQRECKEQFCKNTWKFYYPEGEDNTWVDPSIPAGELDPKNYCSTCRNLICLICCKTLCDDPGELKHMICKNCPKTQCQYCPKIITNRTILHHNACIQCFNCRTCKKCKTYSQDVRKIHNDLLCLACLPKCSACNGPLQSSEEIEATMCKICIDAMLDD